MLSVLIPAGAPNWFVCVWEIYYKGYQNLAQRNDLVAIRSCITSQISSQGCVLKVPGKLF